MEMHQHRARRHSGTKALWDKTIYALRVLLLNRLYLFMCRFLSTLRLSLDVSLTNKINYLLLK